MKLPRYFVFGDRPVRLVATPEGGMDVQAWDWKTGELVRDLSYLSRVYPNLDIDADELDAAAFEAACARLRARLPKA